MKFPIKLISAILFALFLILVGLTLPREANAELNCTTTAELSSYEEEISTAEGAMASGLPESEAEKYTVKFYVEGELFSEEEHYEGDSLSAPDAPDRLGYSFVGWYTDEDGGELFSFEHYAGGDISLYAVYKLDSPKFKLSSLEFIYDGNKRTLTFDSLTHPLAEEGEFSFDWYKNGEALGVSDRKIEVRSVSDSGTYSCSVTFSVNGDLSSVTVDNVIVNVRKKRVPAPTLDEVEYSGFHRSADIADGEFFTVVENEGGIAAGTYPVTLKLRDTENCEWAGGEGELLYLTFNIKKAQNSFITPPSVTVGYTGFSPKVSYTLKFGTAEIYYSVNRDGPWEKDYPRVAGEYYLICVSEEGENYFSTSSSPIPFTVIEEAAVGIRIDTPPTKTEYIAFERIDLTGGKFSVTYNSGRVETLDLSDVSVLYPSGEYLLPKDGHVKISALGVSVPLEVRVLKASYDLSALLFDDVICEYDGKGHTVEPVGQITGKDGIPLKYTVTGGGVNAGEYTVTLSFYSESRNYEIPSDVTAILTILPKEVAAEYENLSFTYDGESKLPKGSVALLGGALVELQMTGAAVEAGSYEASGHLWDTNYKLVNPRVAFVINKADYSFEETEWTGGLFTYNGEKFSVELKGLPEGVYVLGYVDSEGINAGKYEAKATLAYDSRNYNPPPEFTYSWEILKANYDLSGVLLSDKEYIYDSNTHYPALEGEMPTGADGVTLECYFDKGAATVADGRVMVTLCFRTSSTNYYTPEGLSAYVTILPRPITVTWGALDFVYDGAEHKPFAAAPECEISVLGQEVNAGEYEATAVPLDNNYIIENDKAQYRIEKCENLWISTPTAKDYYLGDRVYPDAVSKYGSPYFRYFTDASLQNEINRPTEAGDYFVICAVREGDNYLAISSAPLAFRVIPVLPERLCAELLVDKITAFEKLWGGALRAYVVNNNGSTAPIDFSALEILYENGEHPLVKDSFFTVRYGSFTVKVPYTVSPAEYDMSAVVWKNNFHTYDGSVKRAYLDGLPEGVSVARYDLDRATLAGSYKLSATLAYDKENYKEPPIPDGWLIIEKCPISLPQIDSFIYDGKKHAPNIKGNDLYSVKITVGSSVGSYKITFSLYDRDNYRLPEGGEEVYFKILPRELKVKILSKDSFEITEGSIVSGDSVNITLYEENGYVYAKCDNLNYEIKAEPLGVNDFTWVFILLISLLLLLLILTVYLLDRRNKLSALLVSADSKESYKSGDEGSLARLERTIMAVDEAGANEMISDSIAKSLATKSKEKIETSGKGSCYVSVGELSLAFGSGDVVDINSMKARGIIPKGALRVKVLGGGVIDKPLKIKANGFSKSAVKMIALTAGEAIICKTKPRRK